MPKLTLLTGPLLDPVEQRAVEQLQRYVRTLFGFTPTVSRRPPGSGSIIALGTAGCDPALAGGARLGEQDYLVRRRSPTRLDLCGGSPPAVLWAVYELIEHWGVTFLLQGDVLPEPGAAGAFGLPRVDVVRRPAFEVRLSRILGDMLNTNACASLAEHEKLLDQLSKLRFNAVLGGMSEIDPFHHWSFRGVERRRVGVTYGLRHVIHERTIGRDVIGQTGRYTNPELVGAETFEEQMAAGRRLLRGIIEAAHRRGIKVISSLCLTEVPDEIAVHLPRWSKRYRIPKSSMRRPDVIRLGHQYDRCNHRFGHLMTPLNPVYVELVETSLASFIEQYPGIDGYFLTQSEWPPGAGGIERCWRDLDRRHGLAPKFTYEKLIRQAKRQSVSGSRDRSLHEAQGAVVTIRLLDLILNEREVVSRKLPGHAKLYTSFIGQTLTPVLPHVFDPERIEFLGQLDYLPAHVAEQMDKLEFVRDTDFKFHLQLTVNDDNVGFLPQHSPAALHRTMRAMQRYGIAGYWFRLYETSPYETVIAHIARAAWDRSATPTGTTRWHIQRICGSRALDPMRRACRMLEATVPDVNRLMGVGFMLPHLLMRFWSSEGDHETWQKLIDRYATIEPVLQRAVDASEPRGRRFAGDMLALVRFAGLYLRTAQLVRGAFLSREAAQALKPTPRRPAFDLTAYNAHADDAVRQLDEAVATLEQATRVWASKVRDAADRGSLVGLNVYGLDWLRGKADEVRLETELWSVVVPG